MRIIIEIDGATVSSAKVEDPGPSSLLAAAVDDIFDAGPPARLTGLEAERGAPEASAFDAGAARMPG
jgi:hypothetical protein